ncbi:MAG: NADH-ubiquinone/plastoquinone oxidoreductase subunit 3 [Osedax symbiont Rs2]|nr:MAG: NADH-ubiquinone/plastoquinone oxidoreductase subunit 3 [Osedax symbiont Rs2]
MISMAFVVYFLAIILLTITMLVISRLLNPKAVKRSNKLPFESGIVPHGDTNLRWNVNYFLVAILFVIFDMEAVFLYVWAIVVLETGWPAFFATSVFIFVLLIALVYEWRMGVLEWGKKL